MITKDQALTASMFHWNDRCNGGPSLSTRKGPECWRRNGKTKTWVRRPDAFRVPVKHGLYTYGYLDESNAQYFHTKEDCPVGAL